MTTEQEKLEAAWHQQECYAAGHGWASWINDYNAQQKKKKKVSMKKGSIKLWDREGALVETPASLSQGFAIVKTNGNYPWQLYIVNKDRQGVSRTIARISLKGMR